MAKNISIEVIKLNLDLKNFRTVPQLSEEDAINAMISTSPDRFYAVLDSIIEDGYIPTENIIVLRDGTVDTVKEGNRRIACLKLIQGQYALANFNIPSVLVSKIGILDKVWKKNNSTVPCIVFDKAEENKADRVVSLTHGKGEKASRDKWNSVATARHNRDVNGASEPALNLLEQYLKNGNNLTNQQKERWAGEYPLTVLADAIRHLYSRWGYKNAIDLVTAYPKISNKAAIEDLLRDIGLEQLTFKIIRDTTKDFAVLYGATPLTPPVTTTVSTGTPTTTSAVAASTTPTTAAPTTTTTAPTTTASPPSSGAATTTTPASTSPAYAINDPRRVLAILKKFVPKGNDRSKVVTLRIEMEKLNLKNNPIAFCFLLRSIFEISAKIYCTENSIPTSKVNNNKTYEFTLLELLKGSYNHLTSNGSNTAVVKNLHGAMTELSKSNGILSVTSLNRLVHDPTFSVTTSDVCTLFGNVYPLLEYIN